MTNTMEKVVALAKRRGFVYSSSEIYGGMANTWDFGPLGTLLKNNLRDLWWKHYVLDREDMVGIDASIFLNPKVWDASGHVAGFADALVDCKTCKYRTRADHLIEDQVKGIKVEGLPVEKLTEIIKNKQLKCPKCGAKNLTDVRRFNLLFETSIGILEGEKAKVYLRGEIAQGIFLNFKNVVDTMRVKIPFGIAQQGAAFRNEITMGQYLHRTLGFDLMEFEYFIQPDGWEKVYEEFRKDMWQWALDLGLSEKKLRWREHEAFERSFYSKRTMDIEYEYPFGWKEMFGIAYRTDYDLKNHSHHSGHDLSYLDPITGKSFVPHVVEPTFGLSRLTGIILTDAYFEDGDRVVLKLNPKVAPYKVAVFPLAKNKPEIISKAQHVYHKIKSSGIISVYDDRSSIGKRYLSHDEIGTPWCVTIDYATLEDDTVTVRDRDTTKQERIRIEKLIEYFSKMLH